MLEIVQCFVDVAWHRDVNSPVGVIHREGESVEKRSRPVNGDYVQGEECGNEMVRGGVNGVFVSEVFDNQREYNGQVDVCPEQRQGGSGA